MAVNPDFESGPPGQRAPGWTVWQKLGGSVFSIVRDAGIAHGEQTMSGP